MLMRVYRTFECLACVETLKYYARAPIRMAHFNTLSPCRSSLAVGCFAALSTNIMKFSLHNRIVFPTVLLVVVITALVGAVSFVMSRNMLVKTLDAQMVDTCISTLSNIESGISGQQQQLHYFAADADVRTVLSRSAGSAEAELRLNDGFTRAYQIFGASEGYNLADASGLVVSASSVSAETIGKLNIGDRSYFKVAATGKSAVSEAMISRRTGKPVVVLAVPVKDGDTVLGVIFNVIDLSVYSQRLVAPIRVLETGYAFMFDPNGQVLAHPDETKIMKFKLNDVEWGQRIVTARNGQIAYTWSNEDKIAIFRSSEKLGWGVAITLPASELTAPVRRMTIVIVALGVGSALLGALIAIFTARAIARPVRQVAAQLTANSEQTAQAAHQVSSASNNLAAGASEQAASIEETSSSLEEIASMTKNNADHAREATTLARDARTAAEAGASDMSKLGDAMQGIKSSSDEIQKVVKTIDEIAFQTNILALNAAVEAARAGEAGAGFAVVADEVRTLAQRSAQAAKETAAMVEGALAKTNHGVTLSAKVGQSLGGIVDQIRRVDALVAQVATASGEQNQGIGQVNTAVAQMDKLTQANAATAEESASAAQELNAQAESLKQAVSDLIMIVDGSSKAARATEQAEEALSTVSHSHRETPGKSSHR